MAVRLYYCHSAEQNKEMHLIVAKSDGDFRKMRPLPFNRISWRHRGRYDINRAGNGIRCSIKKVFVDDNCRYISEFNLLVILLIQVTYAIIINDIYF